MARYIDADLAKAEFTGNFQDEYSPAHIKALIDNMPTADVIEVVRCKDCKYWHELFNYGNCDVHTNEVGDITCVSMTDLNDFCCYGEKKERD